MHLGKNLIVRAVLLVLLGLVVVSSASRAYQRVMSRNFQMDSGECLQQASRCRPWGAGCCGDMQCVSVRTQSFCLKNNYLNNECYCMYTKRISDFESI